MGRDAAGRRRAGLRRAPAARASRPLSPSALAEASPALPGDTSYVCVVDRHGNALSATPSDVSWESPVIPGLGFCPVVARVAVLGGARPRLVRGARQAAAAHAESGDGPAPRPMAHALRRAGGRSPAAGHAPGLPEPHRVRDERAGGGRGPALRHPQLPGQLRAASVSPGPARPRAGHRARRGRRRSPALGHRVEWLPDLSIGTAGVCAIAADRERGVLYGGADPRRAARAMGW